MRELVERRLAGRFGLSTVRLYLRRWGTTPRKSLARAEEGRPAVAAWLETLIRRSPAGEENWAVTHWGDGTGMCDQSRIGAATRRGETLVVARTARRVSQSMIAPVSNRGLVRFVLYDSVLGVPLGGLRARPQPDRVRR